MTDGLQFAEIDDIVVHYRVDGPAAGLLADEGIGEIFLGFRRDAATTEGPG